MHYTLWLEDGTEVESNVGGSPFEFILGSTGVIEGWNQGLLGMKAGETRTLTVPPDQAYGEEGSPPNIPPNATLTFEVKVLTIGPCPGLVIEDLEIGTGTEAGEGNAVSVDYTVWSDNGTQLDSTGMGAPLVFTVGQGEVIKGLDQGIVGMRVGDQRQLIIPPDLGYGDEAFKDLPANSNLKCEVELLAVR